MQFLQQSEMASKLGFIWLLGLTSILIYSVEADHSEFLLDKASPLTPEESAAYSKMADDVNVLSANLHEFCHKANLLCVEGPPEPAGPSGPGGPAGPLRHYGAAMDKSIKTVAPGKFFREATLKSGALMVMPDFTDKAPKRSFLPQEIASKLPFSSSELSDIETIFHATSHPAMLDILSNALDECELKANEGETRKCVTSIEGMIDFVKTVLGQEITVRNTENGEGSNTKILLGNVKAVSDGKLMTTVTCHSVLYPYLVYDCHAVKLVRVYEAEILDPKTKAKINNGVAICHENTASFNPKHEVFFALGYGPGKIEVCHWVYQNEFTWVKS